MFSQDEKNAILEQFAYVDSRKKKESRRFRLFAISRKYFKNAYFGDTDKKKRLLISDFFNIIHTKSAEGKMAELYATGKAKKMADVSYNL